MNRKRLIKIKCKIINKKKEIKPRASLLKEYPSD